MSFDLPRLQAFMAVMEQRHFARAGAKLGTSQPSISKNIRALEMSLGVPLFVRGRHGAEPTPFANALARRAELILAESRLAEAEMDAMRGARKGMLAIGAGLSFVPRIMPEALHNFHRRWPGVTVHVTTGLSASLFAALLRGELELVASAPSGPLTSEELEHTCLFSDSQALVVRRGHPLSEHAPQGLSDISSYPWVASRGQGLWERVVQVFLEAGLQPPPLAFDTPSDALAKNLLQQGDYICLLGRELYMREVESGELVSLTFHALTATSTAYITHRKRSPLSAPARNMTSILRKVARFYHKEGCG